MTESRSDQVSAATKAMEAAVYGALEAIDSYQELVTSLIAEQQDSGQPNEKLIKRYQQFIKRADSMTSTLEDDVLEDLLFCLHRLFTLEPTERGEFI
jgi:hypothetical protein